MSETVSSRPERNDVKESLPTIYTFEKEAEKLRSIARSKDSSADSVDLAVTDKASCTAKGQDIWSERVKENAQGLTYLAKKLYETAGYNDQQAFSAALMLSAKLIEKIRLKSSQLPEAAKDSRLTLHKEEDGSIRAYLIFKSTSSNDDGCVVNCLLKEASAVTETVAANPSTNATSAETSTTSPSKSETVPAKKPPEISYKEGKVTLTDRATKETDALQHEVKQTIDSFDRLAIALPGLIAHDKRISVGQMSYCGVTYGRQNYLFQVSKAQNTPRYRLSAFPAGTSPTAGSWNQAEEKVAWTSDFNAVVDALKLPSA